MRSQPEGKNEKPVKPPIVTKTGNSKVVAGYKCDEYIYKEEPNTAKLWLTKEAVFNIDKRVWSKLICHGHIIMRVLKEWLYWHMRCTIGIW